MPVRIKAKPYPPNAPFLGPNGMVSLAWLNYFNNIVDFIATLTQFGTRAEQPLATDVYPGTVYWVTDDLVHERSNGDAWEAWG